MPEPEGCLQAGLPVRIDHSVSGCEQPVAIRVGDRVGGQDEHGDQPMGRFGIDDSIGTGQHLSRRLAIAVEVACQQVEHSTVARVVPVEVPFRRAIAARLAIVVGPLFPLALPCPMRCTPDQRIARILRDSDGLAVIGCRLVPLSKTFIKPGARTMGG